MAHNYDTCGGPDTCEYCCSILSESPDETCARLTAENRERTCPHRNPPNPYAAATRAADDKVDLGAMDDRLADMAAFRGVVQAQRLLALGRGLAAATSDVYLNPPDPYALAVERRRAR